MCSSLHYCIKCFFLFLGCRSFGSCVLRAHAVECRSIPSIDKSVDTSVDTRSASRSTVDKLSIEEYESVDTRPTIDRLLIKCRSSVDRVSIGMSIEGIDRGLDAVRDRSFFMTWGGGGGWWIEGMGGMKKNWP